MSLSRAYRAGESLEDFCRVCKTDRMHTVVAADATGHPVRVRCDYCGSEHNYRGGPRIQVAEGAASDRSSPPSSTPTEATHSRRVAPKRDSFPVVSDRERSAPPIMLTESHPDLELLLRRIIR